MFVIKESSGTAIRFLAYELFQNLSRIEENDRANEENKIIRHLEFHHYYHDNHDNHDYLIQGQ